MVEVQYEVRYTQDAKKDIESLDAALRPVVKKQIEKLQHHPQAGKLLGRNLKGYRKLSFLNKGYRIIYTLREQEVQIIVIGVGKEKISTFMIS